MLVLKKFKVNCEWYKIKWQLDIKRYGRHNTKPAENFIFSCIEENGLTMVCLNKQLGDNNDSNDIHITK